MTTRAAPAHVAQAEPARSPAAPSRPAPSKVKVPRGPAPYAASARLQGGSPMPRPLRTRMERVFDRSFSNVRVHTGAAAAKFTHDHDADAITVGSDIAFG